MTGQWLPSPGAQRSRLGVGIVVAALSVAAATGVIYPLRQFAAPASLGVVYLLAVLLVSTWWGLRLGLATALASAFVFGFFHLPPTEQFTIADSRNWFALGAFAVVAVATSRIADLARSRAFEADARRRDADLAAELARVLLGPTPLLESAPLAARALARALELPSAALELLEVPADERRLALELRDGERRVGTLLVPRTVSFETARRLREHVVPALEAVVSAALEREALQSEVVTTAALRHSDELKTALLRAVSHDLRTPLTAIVAAGHALSQADLEPGEREEMASAIVSESTRLARLVEKLLDLSRLQTGSERPRPAACTLDEPLLAAIEHTGGDVRVAIADDLPVLDADSAQLERAFANLLENAVRHGAAHPVLVRTRAVGDRVVTRIVDRGEGIAPAEQARVFEPFYRGAGSTHGGAGLGLAIARGLIEANGGRVEIESLSGQGTTFVVSFPADPGAQRLAALPR